MSLSSLFANHIADIAVFDRSKSYMDYNSGGERIVAYIASELTRVWRDVVKNGAPLSVHQ